MVLPGCADSYPSSLLQNHTRTVVLRWKWTAKEGEVSGCYGDSCDVLRSNKVCKHCREVQPADSRLFDERQADRCYHHADVASASIPDDASRACLRIDGIEDHPRILPKIPLFQDRTTFIPTYDRSLPPFAPNTLSLKQGSIDTGRRGCGRLSLNKHGLECEQQQSKEKLYVSSWTDLPPRFSILPGHRVHTFPAFTLHSLFSHVSQTTPQRSSPKESRLTTIRRTAPPDFRSRFEGPNSGVFHATGGRMLFATGTKGGVWHKKLWGWNTTTFLKLFFFLWFAPTIRLP